jgi:hypothetical protein
VGGLGWVARLYFFNCRGIIKNLPNSGLQEKSSAQHNLLHA